MYEKDATRGVPSDCAHKLRNMLAYLDGIGEADELWALTSWKPHVLTGNRSGTWSLHVTRNWRLTFRIDAAAGEILDLNLEDYH